MRLPNTEQTGLWRAVGYSRLSKEDGTTRESDSIQSQRKLINDWVEARSGIELVAHYADDGWSGATFDRPGFQQMLEDARNGMFDTIIVKDLSRLGRSYLDCGSLIEREFPKLGIRLYSIADEFDSMQSWDFNMALLLPIKNLMNEMLVMTTSEKVRTSLNAKRKRGECVASFAPYGYKKDPDDPHRLIVDEPAASVVRRIFEYYVDGLSAYDIARLLNSMDTPCPTAYKRSDGQNYQNGFCKSAHPLWHAKTILRILGNETYLGTLVQGKTHKQNWRSGACLPVQPSQWLRSLNAHEALVGRATFSLAAERMKLNAPRRKDSGSVAGPRDWDEDITVPFNVQLICSECGGKMVRTATTRNGKRYVYYVCSTHRKNTRSCGTHSIREDELVTYINAHPRSTRLRVLADGKVSAIGE